MRPVTYFVATSLDGRIAAPDGDFGAFPVEGDHMAAILGEWSDAIPAHVHAALGTAPDGARFDTVLMGWRTYAPAFDAGITSPYPHLRQIVATTRPHDPVDGVELTDDPVGRLRAIAAEPGGGIWIAGGGRLAGALLDRIDRLVLKINPIVLGDGVPLFGGVPYDPRTFRRTALRAFDSGVLIAEYERA